MNAADQSFIDMATAAIQNAIGLGKYQVYLWTFDNCNIATLASYFQGLGYTVLFPEFAPINGSQPGELFGPDFEAYWENQLLPSNTKPKNPALIGIVWGTTTTLDPAEPG